MEFRQNGRLVVIRCDACDRSRAVDPELLVLGFGDAFDVYAGMKELEAQLGCEACDLPHRIIYIHNTQQRYFEPVSLDQSSPTRWS